jgi:hypothetical protein
MGLGSLFVVLTWVLTDPDAGIISALPIGASAVATLIILLKSVLYVGMLHISRIALFDYLSLSEYFTKALRSPEGAGVALMAVSIAMLAISIVMYAATSS